MITFEYWLAQYRAQVKEAIYVIQNQASLQAVPYQELIQAQPTKSTILVIEDSVDEWFLIRWTLSKQFRDAETVWLPDATQTLAYLETETWNEQSLPVMILLDLYMPNAQAGLSLLQTIKGNSRFANVPVVMISRSSNIEDITQAFTYASNAYLIKPENYLDWGDTFKQLNKYWKGSDVLP